MNDAIGDDFLSGNNPHGPEEKGRESKSLRSRLAAPEIEIDDGVFSGIHITPYIKRVIKKDSPEGMAFKENFERSIEASRHKGNNLGGPKAPE